MREKTRTLELLAPAKNAEIGKEAILHGADAVYIGGPAFGARDKAGNPIGEIAELVRFAHKYHAQIFVTLNTILHDDELEPARKLVYDCYDAGVDALIVQDMGILQMDLPPIALHASTQCDIRTPQKARFLSDAGFSQLVLARELTLDEIARVRREVPDDTIIEHFIHGALCVAYSGQCYISHAHTGRSANRGDCSQACRLPYTLQDAQGRVVAFDKHLLSVKDNNQSDNLRALIDAGVQSFKIEGRYKDMAYVKNITAHYRQLIDEILHERPELAASSSGTTKLLFKPDPDKSFHRGSTDYFTNGRKDDIGAFDSPSFVGLPLGTVTKLGRDWFEIETNATLSNSDGLNYLHLREVVGLQANVVERREETENGAIWRIWPNEAIPSLPGLRPWVEINRNRDHAWEHALTRKSAERKIRIRAALTDTENGCALTLTDEDGITATSSIEFDKQPAASGQGLREQLSRFGGSDFELSSLQIEQAQPWFIPNSQLNRLRRDATAALEAARLAAYARPPRKQAIEPPAPYPEQTLSYLANVSNRLARDFYAAHGVRLIEAAYEDHEQQGDVSLMITRHCLRYSLSLCPKQAKGVIGVQGQVRAEPMTLVNGSEKLTLKFDCRACEMHVIGRIKKQVLKGVPIEFHPRKNPQK